MRKRLRDAKGSTESHFINVHVSLKYEAIPFKKRQKGALILARIVEGIPLHEAKLLVAEA